jgi:RNA ligase (TIGR02306 family)
MSNRKLATIRLVKEIRPIEGADRIECALLDGWQCVVPKGDFKPGDKAVYFEIDSFLPLEERYEFLRKSSFRKMGEAEGFRLKTIRLKGTLSQGLAMPISQFPELIAMEDDLLLTERLNVKLYEPPIPASLGGTVKGNFPSFIPKTDEERIQNMPEIFSDYTVYEETEKLDGTSMTVFNTSEDFGVCGRNWMFNMDNENSYMQCAKSMGFEKALKDFGRNMALQGELCGEGIQGNKYRLTGREFFLFNIFLIDENRYALPKERFELHHSLNEKYFDMRLKHVPYVGEVLIPTQLHDIPAVLEQVKGPSQLCADTPREGSVFKSLKSGKSFKGINNDFLLKYG